MTRHHPGDGCDGDDRPLTPEDHDDIAHRMGRMMLAVANRDGLGVLRAGAWIGSHYGPSGEYALALRLAHQVKGLAPPHHCDPDGSPVFGHALADDDEGVLLIATHCITLFPEMREHTSEELRHAVRIHVPLVERFVAHYKHDRKTHARSAWEAMYDMTDSHTPITRTNTLRAGACSALLVCWAAHYSVTPVPA